MKKIIALLLILLMTVFCFAACGEPEEDDKTNDGGTGDIEDMFEDLFGGEGIEGPLAPIEPDEE